MSAKKTKSQDPVNVLLKALKKGKIKQYREGQENSFKKATEFPVFTGYRIKIPFTKTGFFPIKKPDFDKEEPLLFLIKKTGEIELFTNVKTGVFTFPSSSMDDRDEYLLITASKQKMLNYNNDSYRAYIGVEGELLCLPNEIIIDSMAVLDLVKKAISEYKDLHTGKEQLLGAKAFVYIVGGIILLGAGLWILNAFGFRDIVQHWLAQGAAQAAANATNATATVIP